MSDEYWEIDYSAPTREVVGLGHDGTPYFDYTATRRDDRKRCDSCRTAAATHYSEPHLAYFCDRCMARENPAGERWPEAHPAAPKTEPLYRIVWAGNLEADADVALTWPQLLHALRQRGSHTKRRLSAFVARVERVIPNA